MRLSVSALVFGFAIFPLSAAASTLTYWTVFNIEGERAISADIVTYGTHSDMLADTNRLGVFQPQGNFAGNNIVGAGSDGTTYWNVFNIEGERAISADIVTYGTLSDMLADTNRLGVFQPQGNFAGNNIVGAGASVARPGVDPSPAVIPLPAAGWFSLSGLLLLLGLRRSRRAAPAAVRESAAA